MNDLDILSDWSDIALFLAVADAGTLAGAGAKLGLSQPSVGRRLATLEARTGVALFIRTGRRMVLSDTGNAIMEPARRMERQLLAINGIVETQSKGLAGEVVISAAEGLGTEWLAPELVAFQREHPEILINVQIENRKVDLLHREADIALRFGAPTEDDLIARRLVNLKFGLYAQRGLIKDPQSVQSLTDLASYPRVEFSEDRGIFVAQRDVASLIEGDRPTFGHPAGFITNSPAAHIAAVRAGLGYGILSHRWAAMYADELEPLLPGLDLPEAELWLVTHSDLRHSARIRAVADFIAERVQKSRDIFEGEPEANTH